MELPKQPLLQGGNKIIRIPDGDWARGVIFFCCLSEQRDPLPHQSAKSSSHYRRSIDAHVLGKGSAHRRVSDDASAFLLLPTRNCSGPYGAISSRLMRSRVIVKSWLRSTVPPGKLPSSRAATR